MPGHAYHSSLGGLCSAASQAQVRTALQDVPAGRPWGWKSLRQSITNASLYTQRPGMCTTEHSLLCSQPTQTKAGAASWDVQAGRPARQRFPEAICHQCLITYAPPWHSSTEHMCSAASKVPGRAGAALQHVQPGRADGRQFSEAVCLQFPISHSAPGHVHD